MAKGLRELVGRVMIDPDFLAELLRAPETLLAQYELSDAERVVILIETLQQGRVVIRRDCLELSEAA